MVDISSSGAQALRSAGMLWVIGPLWYLLCEAVSASAFPGYSYAGNYISDLGVPETGSLQGRALDSPLHAVMNAGFIGEGLLFLLGLVFMAPVLARGGRRLGLVALVAVGVLHSVGITLVGLVPGSGQNVLNGLIVWHVIGAILAIACGNLAAIVSGRTLSRVGLARWLGPVLGALGFLCVGLLIGHVVLPDGVWERGAVYTFLVWQLVAGIVLMRGQRPADASLA